MIRPCPCSCRSLVGSSSIAFQMFQPHKGCLDGDSGPWERSGLSGGLQFADAWELHVEKRGSKSGSHACVPRGMMVHQWHLPPHVGASLFSHTAEFSAFTNITHTTLSAAQATMFVFLYLDPDALTAVSRLPPTFCQFAPAQQ